MDNETSSLQTIKKSPLIILLVIAIILIGFVYLYSTMSTIILSSQTPSSGEENGTLQSGPIPSSVPGCTCAWKNDYECGGSSDCISPSGERSFEKICECTPSGCGSEKGVACGGFSEGTLACTPNAC